MVFRALMLLVMLAPAALADGPTVLGLALEPASSPAARTPPYRPGPVANGVSSYGGALLGTVVGIAATAVIPFTGMAGPFALGAVLAGGGSALAQWRSTGTVDWRAAFCTGLAGGVCTLFGGGAGAGLKDTLAGTAVVVGVGQLFGSVRETTRVRRLWSW